MIKAKVRVEIGWEESKVKCWFTFKNEGNDTVVLMGFPKRRYALHFDGVAGGLGLEKIPEKFDKDKGFLLENKNRVFEYSLIVYDINDFSIQFDSAKIIPRILNEEVGNIEYDSLKQFMINRSTEYYVWQIPFKNREIKILEHSYLNRNMEERGSAYDQAFWSKFIYILSTGSTWKGNIDTVDIKIYGLTTKYPNWWYKEEELYFFGYPYPYLAREAFILANQRNDYIEYLHQFSPKGYKLCVDTVSWFFTNIEPKFDIGVTLNSWAHMDYINRAVADYLNENRVANGKFIFKGNEKHKYQKELYYGDHHLYCFRALDSFLINPERWIHPYALYHLNSFELWILRNSIYAFRGYKFKNKPLQDYFDRFKWFEPVENFDEKNLTACDRYNIFEIKRATPIVAKYESLRIKIMKEEINNKSKKE